MITYQTIIQVRLDGKHIGDIYKGQSGYQYYPTGSVLGGDIYDTLDACKASLGD